ncbi:hypothetical protein MTR67_016182 [Solanum verrucosum]|uniref:Uncharacterized protein n=1 Tax=Solanum verrucosum TaxID=315347 RepID=A0AAF0QFE6_SOLVR|nr:hypothetical protein MTR67_016182 [Solanum verrucosum]
MPLFSSLKSTTNKWERQDSNLRRKTSTDLQSAAFDHSATLPFPTDASPAQWVENYEAWGSNDPSRGQINTSKTCLTLAISRIKLLQNKRDAQLRLMRKEIAQFLQTGQEAIARIRVEILRYFYLLIIPLRISLTSINFIQVEHIIREQNVWAAYEILELFCEFVYARVPILESQK